MIVGVPKEIKDGENRVAATPETVHALTLQARHRVLVERGAGLGSGYQDDEYRAVGAEIVATAADVWSQADIVVKVKEPMPSEYPHLRADLVLFTYLHLAALEGLTRALVDSGITAIGYETIQTDDGTLPLLVPMSEVAGKMSVQKGAQYLESHSGGRGILLGGVPGVPPAEVVVVGCGVVGLNATKIALGLGAHVTVLDNNPDRLRYLDDVMHGNIMTVFSNPFNIRRAVTYADLVVGAVLVPAARTPVLVTEEMVKGMKRGSVIVDVAVDQGSCVETMRPTSHSDPVFTLHDVIHYGVTNIPAAVPRTSTRALTNVTTPYLANMADHGVHAALAADPALARGVNVMAGKVVQPEVARTFGYEAADLSALLAG